MTIRGNAQAPLVVVVGAGAAGLTAAIHAAGDAARGGLATTSALIVRTTSACDASALGLAADESSPDRSAATHATTHAPPRVLVLESTRDGGRKIVASGGGRCNVLPGEADERGFVTSSSPNTLRKMLRSWPLPEQRAFFEEVLGLPLRLEPESGKLFPASSRARDVRDALVAEARRRGVDFRFDARVTRLHPPQAGGGAAWRVHLASGEAIDAEAVVLATGGLSVPATGSDGAGLAMARALGHAMHPTTAALTPLVDDARTFADLAGVSLDVTIEAVAGKERLRTHGGFLFTHRGYSGPAVLNVSHLAVRACEDPAAPRPALLVQWTPLEAAEWEAALAPRAAGVAGVLRRHLPLRLAEALLAAADVPADRSLAELRREEKRRLVQALARFELPWTGHEGYRVAEVTSGGVALSEVDPRSMQSRRTPGLFLCGEVLDAFGPIGGFNFQWAWATGRAAGLGASAAVASADGSR